MILSGNGIIFAFLLNFFDYFPSFCLVVSVLLELVFIIYNFAFSVISVKFFIHCVIGKLHSTGIAFQELYVHFLKSLMINITANAKQ